MSTEGKEGNSSYLKQRLEIAFQAHLQQLWLFLFQGWELCLRLSLCKPLRALQSSPSPAPQNFSSSPPPPPPLQDTPPVISCVNHTGCLKTWSRISPTVVSSFLYEYPLGYVALYTPLKNILWKCGLPQKNPANAFCHKRIPWNLVSSLQLSNLSKRIGELYP